MTTKWQVSSDGLNLVYPSSNGHTFKLEIDNFQPETGEMDCEVVCVPAGGRTDQSYITETSLAQDDASRNGDSIVTMWRTVARNRKRQ